MIKLNETKVEVVTGVYVNQISQYKLLGKIKMPKGTIFEYDPKTSIIGIAELVNSETKGIATRLLTKENRIYVTALNFKNAKAKLLNRKIFIHTLKNTNSNVR